MTTATIDLTTTTTRIGGFESSSTGESLIWVRDPVYGGCRYYLGDLITVSGDYDPPYFEGDCEAWTASNLKGEVFPSSDAAMDAAASKAEADGILTIWRYEAAERQEVTDDFDLEKELAIAIGILLS